MKKSAFLFFTLFISARLFGQGTLSGDFMTNLNQFMKDSVIKASDNPLYDNALSGGEAWLTLRYNVHDFTFFLRADAFQNSNLKVPTAPNSDFGIGAWSISKDIGDLSITVGSIYDQIGSGILFRSYEDRGLLIDNSLIGGELKYRIKDKVLLKAFGGQQKDNSIPNDLVNNTPYRPIIKGFNAEGDLGSGKLHLAPGAGFLNRTLDADNMNIIANAINTQEPIGSRFLPKYNMYAATAYNMLTYKNFSWYVEGAYKTHEAIYDTRPYSDMVNKLVNNPGNIQYTSLNYGRKGIALGVSAKRTENFAMRVSPNQTLLNGMLNWQPVVAVLRPLRLMSRYQPPSQDLSEMAGTANANISPNDKTSITLTYSHINTLRSQVQRPDSKVMVDSTLKLYREAYADVIYEGLDSWVLEAGVQYLEYNISLYQNRPAGVTGMQFAITPFAEITYRIDDVQSLRAEFQYMHAKYDYGSWAFALLEYNIAPKWSISIQDMYNVGSEGADNPNYVQGVHYYSAFTAYTRGANRFTLAYVKQVDGINCTGGVCRYEPAFSGIKATITSSF